jgi:hypothetical protein
MSSSYIPAEDAHALEWMQVFASGLNSNPGLYGVSPANAAAVSAAVAIFASAYELVIDPATKTKVTVADKDDARANAEALCRLYATQIKAAAGISDGDKIAIGVRPPNPTREPIPVPQSSPLLSIIAATQGGQTLRYSDQFTPDSAAKPFGAVSLQLFVAIGTAPTANEDEATFLGSFTKNPIAVPFAPDDDGKVATYFAKWQSRKGDTGPWSTPVSMRIAA